MNDEQLFDMTFNRAKELAQKGGELSTDYGKIPFLRDSNISGKPQRAMSFNKYNLSGRKS
jgi:hypothetical protein